MYNRLPFSLLAVLIILFSLKGCSDTAEDVNPAESDQWEHVTTVKGHEDHHSDYFKTNGQPLMITYEAKSTKNWTHCSLEVFLVKGIESTFSNKVLTLLNRDKASGKKIIKKPGEKYYLRVKSLEMDYNVKVYRKKDKEQAKT